jgi:hypothetical protein
MCSEVSVGIPQRCSHDLCVALTKCEGSVSSLPLYRTSLTTALLWLPLMLTPHGKDCFFFFSLLLPLWCLRCGLSCPRSRMRRRTFFWKWVTAVPLRRLRGHGGKKKRRDWEHFNSVMWRQARVLFSSFFFFCSCCFSFHQLSKKKRENGVNHRILLFFFWFFARCFIYLLFFFLSLIVKTWMSTDYSNTLICLQYSFQVNK